MTIYKPQHQTAAFKKWVEENIEKPFTNANTDNGLMAGTYNGFSVYFGQQDENEVVILPNNVNDDLGKGAGNSIVVEITKISKTLAVAIFIKSYAKDFNWLSYCMQSIEKFVTGCHEIIIVVPPEEVNALRDKVKLPVNATIHTLKEQCNGYLFQQYAKLIAHKYSKADYIMYVDSDCLFKKPIDIRTLVENEGPMILYTPYDQVGEAICWKEPTQIAMEREVEFEYMRRNLLIYHRSTVEHFQRDFEKRHNCSLLEYFLKVDRISEFNLLGCYAWFHEHYKYKWIDTTTQHFPPEIGKQFWSYSGLNEKDLAEINEILK